MTVAGSADGENGTEWSPDSSWRSSGASHRQAGEYRGPSAHAPTPIAADPPLPAPGEAIAAAGAAGGAAIEGEQPTAPVATQPATRPVVHKLTTEQATRFRRAQWDAVREAVLTATLQQPEGAARSEAAFAAFEQGVLSHLADCKGLSLDQLLSQQPHERKEPPGARPKRQPWWTPAC